jgi:hypothetical protein
MSNTEFCTREEFGKAWQKDIARLSDAELAAMPRKQKRHYERLVDIWYESYKKRGIDPTK